MTHFKEEEERVYLFINISKFTIILFSKMFTISSYSNARMIEISNSLETRAPSIAQLKALPKSVDNEIKRMLAITSKDPLCTTVVSTDRLMGLTEMKVTTKFTSLEMYNAAKAAKLVDGFMKHAIPLIQKKVVTCLANAYKSAMNIAAEGMSELHSFSDLMYYRRLFYYYTDSITFMLDQYGEMSQARHMREKHTELQAQFKRVEKMEINRALTCGIPAGIVGCFVIYPFMLIADLTVCCWAPCFVACKIASLDNDIEQDRIRRIKERQNYW